MRTGADKAILDKNTLHFLFRVLRLFAISRTIWVTATGKVRPVWLNLKSGVLLMGWSDFPEQFYNFEDVIYSLLFFLLLLVVVVVLFWAIWFKNFEQVNPRMVYISCSSRLLEILCHEGQTSIFRMLTCYLFHRCNSALALFYLCVKSNFERFESTT